MYQQQTLENLTFFQRLLEVFRSTTLYDKGRTLVRWQSVPSTGLVFFSLNVFFLLYIFGGYSLTSIVFYMLLCGLVVSFGIIQYGKFRNIPSNVPQLKTISSDNIYPITTFIFNVYRIILEEFKKLFDMKNLASFVKFSVACYLITFLESLISFSMMVYLGILVLFSWPRLYEYKQKEIDDLYDKVSKLINARIESIYPRARPSTM
eukprot:TRINITY_DN6269_c0_g1_i1.p1 TRINITY_DN6269_c0_g1~~TRINITY_DN6269_c0_g1_i1.p1  ORF type:complete len:206 (+),score=24.24 TRINITY_DN6269_c0_g1_i1:108-725(+)